MGALEAGLQVGQYFVEMSEIGEDDLLRPARAMPPGCLFRSTSSPGDSSQGEALKAIAGAGSSTSSPALVPGRSKPSEGCRPLPSPRSPCRWVLEAGRLVVATDDPFDESRRRRLRPHTQHRGSGAGGSGSVARDDRTRLPGWR
jgi:hypothetical protein